jgi:hypothetical protein
VLVNETWEIVNRDAIALDPGVTLAGEKEQVNVFGRPLQDSAMALLKAPECGCAVTIKLPDRPTGNVIDAGVALREKVAGIGGGGGGGGGAHVGV